MFRNLLYNLNTEAFSENLVVLLSRNVNLIIPFIESLPPLIHLPSKIAIYNTS